MIANCSIYMEVRWPTVVKNIDLSTHISFGLPLYTCNHACMCSIAQ